MQARLQAENNPNLLVMRYDARRAAVTDLIVSPPAGLRAGSPLLEGEGGVRGPAWMVGRLGPLTLPSLRAGPLPLPSGEG